MYPLFGQVADYKAEVKKEADEGLRRQKSEDAIKAGEFLEITYYFFKMKSRFRSKVDN